MFVGAALFRMSLLSIAHLLAVALICYCPVRGLAEEVAVGPELLQSSEQDDLTEIAVLADSNAAVWLINTRGIGSSVVCSGDVPEFVVCRHSCQSGWTDASLADFLAEDFAGVTVFYIHGNDTDGPEAKEEGLFVHRKLSAAHCGSLPLRLVIWSWPSARSGGRLRGDAQAKAARTNVDARLLARVIDQMPIDAPISLIGYSFGARVATGALQLLAGGNLNGRPLENQLNTERSPLRVALIAAAIDSESLAPGRRLGLAVTQTDQMLITVNSSDRVLHWYRYLYGRGGPSALGATGPLGLGRSSSLRQVIQQWDVSRWLRRSHMLESYLRSSAVVSRIARVVLFEDVSATETTVAE